MPTRKRCALLIEMTRTFCTQRRYWPMYRQDVLLTYERVFPFPVRLISPARREANERSDFRASPVPSQPTSTHGGVAADLDLSGISFNGSSHAKGGPHTVGRVPGPLAVYRSTPPRSPERRTLVCAAAAAQEAGPIAAVAWPL